MTFYVPFYMQKSANVYLFGLNEFHFIHDTI